eukprot:s2795_g5.t1
MLQERPAQLSFGLKSRSRCAQLCPQPSRCRGMVKILANGEIVPDNDPRAQASGGPTQRRPEKRPSESKAQATRPAEVGEENVIVGDLARMLGVYGKSQEVMGREIPLIYLIVGGVVALLWLSGNTSAIRMIAFALILYVMYTQYTRAQRGGSAGPGAEDNSSGGHVINRGR